MNRINVPADVMRMMREGGELTNVTGRWVLKNTDGTKLYVPCTSLGALELSGAISVTIVGDKMTAKLTNHGE